MTGSLVNNVDVRSPIFYDSNNVSFFLDPASTGQSLRAAGHLRADYLLDENNTAFRVDPSGSSVLNTVALTTATVDTSLAFSEAIFNGTNTVSIKAANALAASYTLTLPSDDGLAGEALTTDGTGTLSWVSSLTAAAGDIRYVNISGDTMTG